MSDHTDLKQVRGREQKLNWASGDMIREVYLNDGKRVCFTDIHAGAQGRHSDRKNEAGNCYKAKLGLMLLWHSV